MYRIEKRFTLPIGHRLSKHPDRCASIHGHNFIILVGLKAEQLNENDMIIDFSNLKQLVNLVLDDYDHALLVNEVDRGWMVEITEKLGMRGIVLDGDGSDPTAEKLSEHLFKRLDELLGKMDLTVDYITVYENENSKATYSLE
jgi:6-pyruvoyltetrahydropterin/6-carboxytetrahydropterin synthase